MNSTNRNEKQKNLTDIFREIYEGRSISKQQLAKNLNLSLPTVTQNLTALEKKGLIYKKGFFESTGGRPASSYVLNEKFKVSVGVELLASGANFSLVDLYGKEFHEESINLTFCPDEKYFRHLGNSINDFIKKNTANTSSVLGVDISIPGIISEDKKHILFAEVLKSSDIALSDFEKYIEFPCGFYHDAEANTEAELWLGEKTDNAHYFFLNRYFCNALVLNGEIQKNRSLSSGTIEHMILHTGGRPCYCGKKGCVDSYCSAASLISMSGNTSIDDFFLDLRSGNNHAVETWNVYLDNLAQTIDNARMIIACDVVIGGLIQQYMTKEDMELLKTKVMEITTFKNSDFELKRGSCGKNFTRIGVTIPRIVKYLAEI